MKFGIFASDYVGFQIVKFFEESHCEYSFLILDSKNRNNYNDDILKIHKKNGNTLLLYNEELKDQEKFNKLKDLSIDIGILAWWPYILKDNVLDIPKTGYLNFHPSLLPYNRGKDPNFWSIAEDTPFGVTLHFINEGIDSGDIVFQKEIEKTWEDTGESLYKKSINEILDLFKSNFNKIKSGDLEVFKQNLDKGTFHKRSELDPASEIMLDKTYTARELLNVIRARTFPPHPACWFIDNGKKYEVRISIKEKSLNE